MNIGSKSAISLQPKISGRSGRPHQPESSQKTRLNDLSHGIKIWTDFSSLLSQCTHLTDGRTERRTGFSSQDRVCIPCSAVKMVCFYGLLGAMSASFGPLCEFFVKKSTVKSKGNICHRRLTVEREQ